jgi:hypothetical protein
MIMAHGETNIKIKNFLIPVTGADVTNAHSILYSELHIQMSQCDTTVSFPVCAVHSGQQSPLQS